jgi:hypothetical protein
MSPLCVGESRTSTFILVCDRGYHPNHKVQERETTGSLMLFGATTERGCGEGAAGAESARGNGDDLELDGKTTADGGGRFAGELVVQNQMKTPSITCMCGTDQFRAVYEWIKGVSGDGGKPLNEMKQNERCTGLTRLQG